MKERTPEQLARVGVIKKLHLPAVSFAARRLFPFYPKIWESRENTETLNAAYSHFADGETLIGYNFSLKTRDARQALPGDLLVYHKGYSSDEPYHVMLVGSGRREPMAVYHNGASGDSAGVRVVSLSNLYRSPETTWIPAESNPQFLGVYQWRRFRPEESGAQKS